MFSEFGKSAGSVFCGFAFCFDVYLDYLLQTDSVALVLVNRLKHVNKTFVNLENRETNMKFGEVDSKGKVNRLGNLIRSHPWTYFITITCADRNTLGVWPIRHALERKFGTSSVKLHIGLQNNCTILSKAWSRTLSFFFKYLLNSDGIALSFRTLAHATNTFVNHQLKSVRETSQLLLYIGQQVVRMT